MNLFRAMILGCLIALALSSSSMAQGQGGPGDHGGQQGGQGDGGFGGGGNNGGFGGGGNNGGFGGGGGFPPPPPPPPYYPPVGACMISTYYNGAFATYTVTDGYGSVLATNSDYNYIYSVALQAQQRRSCSSIINSAPPAPQNFCQILPGANALGQQFFRVVSRSGAILYNTSNYVDAQNFERSSQACFQ